MAIDFSKLTKKELRTVAFSLQGKCSRLEDALQKETAARMAAQSSSRLNKLWWKVAETKLQYANYNNAILRLAAARLEEKAAEIESRTGQSISYDVYLDDLLKASKAVSGD